jgi:hypothetical protein
MLRSMDEYRTKLVNKILFATSHEEVMRFIETAMKALEKNKVNGHIICRFAEKMTSHLESFSPMEEEAQQWSNIKIAMILFNRIQKQLNSPVY